MQDDTVHFADITPGRDYGTSIEVLKGLTPDDKVIDNPGLQLADGSKVQIKNPNESTPATSGPRMARAN